MADQDNPYRASTIDPTVATISRQATRIPMILGILMWIFGVFGFVGVVFGLFLILSPDLFRIPEETRKAMDLTSPIILGGYLLGTATVICELIAGTGLLKYRLWGRRYTLIYGVLAIIGAIWSLAQQVYINGQLIPPNMPKEMEGFMISSMLIGVLITLTLPIACLILMFNQKVLAALD